MLTVEVNVDVVDAVDEELYVMSEAMVDIEEEEDFLDKMVIEV